MKIRIKSNLVFVILIAIFFAVFFWFKEGYQITKSCEKKFNWINSRLACDVSQGISKHDYVVFTNNLSKEIASMRRDGLVEEASVYFRDLNFGPTFGINEDEDFSPASLLKVPVMMTYFKIAEDEPTILSKQLVLSNIAKEPLTQTISDDEMIQVGGTYTVDELILRTIAYSDNRAFSMLVQYLQSIFPNKDVIAETYHELGLLDPEENIELETITVKSYASIFRLLYNASYLSNEFSDKALEYLSRSTFADGIRAGVPENIKISHKFGERFIGDSRQLHDCGIVFFPENPYLICIMTKGKNSEDLAKAIAKISELVYKEVDSRKQ